MNSIVKRCSGSFVCLFLIHLKYIECEDLILVGAHICLFPPPSFSQQRLVMVAVTLVVLWVVGSILIIGSLVVLGPWKCGTRSSTDQQRPRRREAALETWYRAAHAQHRAQLIELTHACNQHDAHLQQLLAGAAAAAAARATEAGAGASNNDDVNSPLSVELALTMEVQLLRQDLNQLLSVLSHQEDTDGSESGDE